MIDSKRFASPLFNHIGGSVMVAKPERPRRATGAANQVSYYNKYFGIDILQVGRVSRPCSR